MHLTCYEKVNLCRQYSPQFEYCYQLNRYQIKTFNKMKITPNESLSPETLCHQFIEFLPTREAWVDLLNTTDNKSVTTAILIINNPTHNRVSFKKF